MFYVLTIHITVLCNKSSAVGYRLWSWLPFNRAFFKPCFV